MFRDKDPAAQKQRTGLTGASREKAASGVNQGLKIGLLEEEGVGFDGKGGVKEKWRVVEMSAVMEAGDERKLEWARKELETIEKAVRSGTLITS